MLAARFMALIAFVSAATMVFMGVATARSQSHVHAPKVPRGFDLAAAMTGLYGNYDWGSGSSRILAQDSLSDQVEIQNVRAFFMQAVPDSDSNEVLLATFATPAAVNFDCHVCRPLIGAGLFKRGTGGWTIEAAQKPIDLMMSAWGDRPEAEIFQYGPRHFGIRLAATAEAQGETATDVCLLIPWVGGFSKALNIAIEDDNSNDCGEGLTPCHALHRTLKFVPGKNPEFYDLAIATSGTASRGGYVADVSGTTRLTLADGKYGGM